MRSKRSFIHFNAGEWSPKVDARVDHESYPAACRQLQNMIPMPHGPVTKRKGFQFIAETKNSTKESRLMRFQFSRDVTYCIEAGNLYFRFYKDGAQIQSGGSPYELTTTYTESEVKSLQFAQVNDILFIVHENHPPRTLGRISDTNWALADVAFDFPALLDENTETSQTLALSATEGTGVTMTAAGHSPFTADHVGSYWRLGHFNTEDINRRLGSTFTADLATDGIFVVGKFTVETTGRWSGEFDLEQDDNASFTSPTTIRTFDSNFDKNYNSEFEAPEAGAWYRFKNNGLTQGGGGDRDDRARLNPQEAIRQGIVQVTAFSSATSVTVDVLVPALSIDVTDIWNEGAFSTERGFPKCVTFYENRIVYASTQHQPQTFWGSVTDDYYNFQTGEEDTDSYNFTLASPERNEIQWLGNTQQLLIGTSGGEWVAAGNDVNTTITPTSIQVRQHTSNGSLPLRPMLFEGRISYMQRGGRKLRSMQYDGAVEQFKSEDLTILSDHLTAGGVTSMAYQAQRDSIIWATTGNGKLIGMTYEPHHNVTGWHRHETDGDFEWVETIYGAGDDEVWVIVRRQIQGVAKRYIENFRGYFNPTVDGGVGGSGLNANSGRNKIQIAFCLDVTGSMSSEIEAAKTEIVTIAQNMEQRYDDAEFALVVFRDEDETTAVTDFTTASNIATLINDYTASGGDDIDENGFGAIVLACNSFSWDTGLKNDLIVFVATDAGSHERGNTQAEAQAALQAKGARLVYGDVNSSDYGDIVTAVGGYRVVSLIDYAEDFINNVPLFGYSEGVTERRFVDSSVSYADSPATVFTGLDHLEGKTVQILADGAVQPTQVVSGGQITLANAASVVHVGLPYEAIMQPMRLDIDSQFGVMQAKEKRIYEAVLYLMDTGSVRIKTDETQQYDYVRDVQNDPLLGETLALFTGETKPYNVSTRSSTDPTFILSSEQPLPFTLVAAILKYNLTGQ